MTDEQDIHDLRGEIRGIRGDVHTLTTAVQAGFEKMNERVHSLEVAQIEANARMDERAKLLASGVVVQVVRPPIGKDPRTYSVGGVAVAVGGVIAEIIRSIVSAPK